MARSPSFFKLQASNLGKAAEELALQYLLSEQGVSRCLIARNYRSRFGEIDLILEEKRESGEVELVFVEVRARSRGGWVDGVQSVSFPKQLRLSRVIAKFLSRYSGAAGSVRLDLLSWDGMSFTHLRNVWIGGS